MNTKSAIRFVSILLCLAMLMLAGCQNTEDLRPGETTSGGPAEPVLEGITMMQNGHGVAVTELETLTEESLSVFKAAGVTFVKVHIPFPFDAVGNPSNGYIAAKRAVKLIAQCGLEPVLQSFTPGGNAYNAATGKVEWMSYLPNVFDDYDDEYFYKLIAQGCEYIGKDLAEYGNCWIISNEPNIVAFTGPMTNEQICKYILTCAGAIEKGNPKAYCGVNMFGSADKAKAMRLLPKLYGEDSCLDYLGLDSYFGTLVGGGAEDWDSYITTYHNVVNVPIMITEFSYSSYVYNEEDRENDGTGLQYNSPVCRDKKFSFEWGDRPRNEQTQREYAEACIEIFKKHSEVIGWCWFSNIDKDGPCWECGDTHCPMESSWGLMYSDGTVKPVLSVIGQTE